MTASASNDAPIKEPHRFAVRLPRLRWVVLSTAMLIAGFIVFQIYRVLYDTIP